MSFSDTFMSELFYVIFFLQLIMQFSLGFLFYDFQQEGRRLLLARTVHNGRPPKLIRMVSNYFPSDFLTLNFT